MIDVNIEYLKIFVNIGYFLTLSSTSHKLVTLLSQGDCNTFLLSKTFQWNLFILFSFYFSDFSILSLVILCFALGHMHLGGGRLAHF